MILSARPIVLPIDITIFTWNFVFFWLILNNGDGRIDGLRVKIVITTYRDCGSAEWIINYVHLSGKGLSVWMSDLGERAVQLTWERNF